MLLTGFSLFQPPYDELLTQEQYTDIHQKAFQADLDKDRDG
jgi:hypothetical protein